MSGEKKRKRSVSWLDLSNISTDIQQNEDASNTTDNAKRGNVL